MQVTINDVVLRDGLQDEPVFVEVTDRVRIAEALLDAGLTHLRGLGWDCSAPARDDQRFVDGRLGTVFYCAGLTADGKHSFIAERVGARPYAQVAALPSSGIPRHAPGWSSVASSSTPSATRGPGRLK